MKKWFGKALCGAVVSLAMAGAVQARQDELRIGAVLALSGPASVFGTPAEKGLRLMLDDHKTLGGRPVKLTVYDSEGSTTKAVQLVRRLVENDDVHVIVGPTTSGESLAAGPVANQLKVTMISNGAAEAITTPVTPYVFGIVPPDRLVAGNILELMKKRNMKNVALLYSMDGMGQSGATIVQQIAGSFGVNIIAAESFNPSDTGMTPQLLRIREKNPEGIIVWSANPGPTIALRNAADLGIKTPFFLSYANASNWFVEQTGAAAEGVYVSSFPLVSPQALPDNSPRKAPLIAFEKRFREKFGATPDQSAGHSMDQFIILEEALKTIKGPVTRVALRDAIEKVKMCGANGCRQLSAQDHRGLDNDALVMMQIKNGKWVAVTE